MSRLSTLGARRSVLAAARRSAQPICARWLGTVLRGTIQPALELDDSLILAGDTRLELLDPAIHPQENFNDDLTPRVIDRLGLGALHRYGFDGVELCPPEQLNAYRICCD